jgi:hypothetical protein
MKTKLNLYMPEEIKKLISENAKKLRLQKELKRDTLSAISGVPTPSIVRFETTGEISLSSLLKIAHALDSLEIFTNLFASQEPLTLDEFRTLDSKNKERRRGIK